MQLLKGNPGEVLRAANPFEADARKLGCKRPEHVEMLRERSAPAFDQPLGLIDHHGRIPDEFHIPRALLKRQFGGMDQRQPLGFVIVAKAESPPDMGGAADEDGRLDIAWIGPAPAVEKDL